MTRTVSRFRLGVVCLALVAVAFLQEPGRVAADTKLDLAANPVAFLGRALHMWDASGFFGQVQNQAYGYLWPIGTLFAAMDLGQVVPWSAQRIWWSIVLVTGFLGVVRLSGLLGVRRTAPRVIAGLGYVLSVRMVSELTTVSVEVWPMALAPWVLVPLVRVAQTGGSARRAAARSAGAFALTGAINAVASAAILVGPALFLALHSRGRDGRRLLGWWGACIALASVWWVVPLLLLSRYAPPFLDWIESASVTTGFNDPTSVLRGASHWIPYLIDAQGPIWPAGWTLVHSALPVLGSGVVTAVGLWGLLRRPIPERAFLVLMLSAGVVLTGLGHVSLSGLGGPGADEVRALLDGVLAPFRNVHKFQPLVTLPLMIGLAHAVDVAWQPASRRLVRGTWRQGSWQPVAAAVAVVAVALAALPAWTGSLVGGRSYLELPGYWRETAQWLNEQDDGRALVVPAASFGVYLWGRTQDEPLQALDTQAWAVRDAVPLSSAGNIRLLDQVQRMLGAGTGSAGLAPALARSGVRYLVLRNDLEGRATQSALPVLVHQALATSPGIERVASFGPILASVDTETHMIDRGLRRSYPAVEVFRVAADGQTVDGRVSLRDAGTVVEFSGSSEALPDLVDSGLLTDRAAIALGDPVPPESAVSSVLTDTYRRSEANFGAAQRQYGNTLTATDPYRATRAVHDYLPVDPDGRQAVARLVGARSVTASSAGSSPFALRSRAPAAQPWAALDGDTRTAWLSGDLFPGVGQWWEVDLGSALDATYVEVSLVTDERVGDAPQIVRVSTDAGSSDQQVDPNRTWQRLALPGGPGVSRIRLELVAVSGGGAGQGFGLAEVRIPGVQVERPLLVPGAADGGLVLSARSTGRESCATTDTAIICDPALADPSEDDAGIDRIVDVEAEAEYQVQLRLRPRPGAALDAYLAAPTGTVQVSASSQVASDPAVRAQAAADQDPRTTWVASPLDREPRLSVSLGRQQQVSGIQLQTAPDVPASRPLAVEVRLNGVTLPRFVDDSGRIDLPDVTTDRLEIRFGATSPVRSTSSGTGATVLLPVGVTELQVLGAADRRMRLDDDADIPVPCGFAPSVQVDDAEPVVTAAQATVGGVLTGALATGSSCGGSSVRLSAGEHRIKVAPTAQWSVERVDLVPVEQAGAAPDLGRPAVSSWNDTARVVSVPPASTPRLLETTESFNDGWVATLDDRPLTAYRVEGWRQAWLVPAGVGGTVQLTYAPDAGYRTGLAVGLVGLLALAAAALLPARGRPLRPIPPANPRRLLAVAPPAAAVVVGGVWAVVGVVVVLATFLLVRRRRDVRGAVAACTAAGLAGVSSSLAAQAVWTWPGRAQVGWLLDAVLILGPAMALAALGCVVLADDGRAPGSDAPASAS